jgi:hypothetical protein
MGSSYKLMQYQPGITNSGKPIRIILLYLSDTTAKVPISIGTNGR